MIGEDFKFGDTWLSEFEMVMSSPEEDQQFAVRELDRAEITALRPAPNFYAMRYGETLELYASIIKESALCGSSDSDIFLSGDEIHYLRAWLEGPKVPTELILPSKEDEMTTHYFGVFTSVQPLLNEGVCYGLSLIFTCDAPYGYSDFIRKKVEFADGAKTNTFKFRTITSETEEYLRPVVTVHSPTTFTGQTTVTITNTSDNDGVMSFKLPSGKDTIVIDCQKKIVTDKDGNLIPMSAIGLTAPSSSYYNFISADMHIFHWLSLVGGQNMLTVTLSESGDVDYVEIGTRFLIKSGGF